MKLTPYTPSTRRPASASPTFSAGLNPFKTISSQAKIEFKPLQSEERFLCNYNGQAIFGGGRLNLVG